MTENNDAEEIPEGHASEALVDEIYNRKLRDRTRPAAFSAAVVEPFTLAWLGITLAEGAVAWVGGQLFAKLLGKGAPDIGALVQQFIQAVRSIVREEIAANELRILGADLSALQVDLLHYLNAPKGRDRLESATLSASRVTAQLQTFGLSGHASYLLALSTHIVVLQERRKIFGRSENANILETLARGIQYLEKIHTLWRSWLGSQYSVKETGGLEGGKENLDWVKVWQIYRNGALIGEVRSQEEIATLITADTAYQWDTVYYPQHIRPSETVINHLRKLQVSLSS